MILAIPRDDDGMILCSDMGSNCSACVFNMIVLDEVLYKELVNAKPLSSYTHIYVIDGRNCRYDP